MRTIHDLIKIEFTNIGYLPNQPYYLISDKEMFDAFIKEDEDSECLFNDFYYCPEDYIDEKDSSKNMSFRESYEALRECIHSRIWSYLEEGNPIPDWVYSYMLLRPVTYESDEFDIAYMYKLLNLENKNGIYEFTSEVARYCYLNSVDWIKRMPSQFRDRVPTMFGETHVTKSLRLAEMSIFPSEEST